MMHYTIEGTWVRHAGSEPSPVLELPGGIMVVNHSVPDGGLVVRGVVYPLF